MESPILIGAGCTPVRVDFICSFLLRLYIRRGWFILLNGMPNNYLCMGVLQIVGISYQKISVF